jgi:hypothetical protein
LKHITAENKIWAEGDSHDDFSDPMIGELERRKSIA